MNFLFVIRSSRSSSILVHCRKEVWPCPPTTTSDTWPDLLSFLRRYNNGKDMKDMMMSRVHGEQKHETTGSWTKKSKNLFYFRRRSVVELKFPQLEESCDALNFVMAICWGNPSMCLDLQQFRQKFNYCQYGHKWLIQKDVFSEHYYLELSFKQSFHFVWNNLPESYLALRSLKILSDPFDQTKGWQKPPGDLNFSTVEVQLNIEKVGWRKDHDIYPCNKHDSFHMSAAWVAEDASGCWCCGAGTDGLILPSANRIPMNKQVPQTAIHLLLLFIKGIIISCVFDSSLNFLSLEISRRYNKDQQRTISIYRWCMFAYIYIIGIRLYTGKDPLLICPDFLRITFYARWELRSWPWMESTQNEVAGVGAKPLFILIPL